MVQTLCGTADHTFTQRVWTLLACLEDSVKTTMISTKTGYETRSDLGSSPIWSVGGSHDWHARYEQTLAQLQRERKRAEAAEAQCKESHCCEMRSTRSYVNLQRQRQFKESLEKMKEVGLAVQNALNAQKEVMRLK